MWYPKSVFRRSKKKLRSEKPSRLLATSWSQFRALQLLFYARSNMYLWVNKRLDRQWIHNRGLKRFVKHDLASLDVDEVNNPWLATVYEVLG